MRAALAALAVLVPLSACAGTAGPSSGPVPYDGRALQARLIPLGVGPLSFHVNRPAHVAIFEVDPRTGLQLVYPRFGSEANRVFAGTHSVWRSPSGFARSGSGLWPMQVGWGSRAAMQPRVFYLIASERPLRVAPYIGSSFALNAALGGYFTTNRAFSLTHDLARLIVPDHQRGNWVADMYVEWPSYDPLQDVRYVMVTCPDGRAHLAPVGFNPCRPPLTSVQPPDSVGGPAGQRPERPDRRRPEREDRQRDRVAGEAGAADSPSALTRPERGTRAGPRGRGDSDAAGSRPSRAPATEAQTERPARGHAAPQPRRGGDAGSSRSASPSESAAPQRSVEPASRPSTPPSESRAAPPSSSSSPSASAPSRDAVDPQ